MDKPQPVYRSAPSGITRTIGIDQGHPVISGAILDKQASKFNDEESQYLLEWIRDLTKETFDCAGGRDNFREQLKDGIRLCK